MFIEYIAKIFLTFGHDTIVVPLVILGYIWLDKRVFYSAVCLVLVSMIFNTALKVTFKIPLAANINKEWFAFPSGHMQTVVVLYGWLMAKTKNNIVRLFLLTILAGEWFSLIYFGYHNQYDIVGAVFFGLVLLLVYQMILSKKELHLPWILFYLTTVMMIYIAYVYHIKYHVWMAYYALIGFMISEYLCSQSMHLIKTRSSFGSYQILNKIIATILCLGIIFLVKELFKTKCMADLEAVISQMQWGLIGLSIPFSRWVAKIN